MPTTEPTHGWHLPVLGDAPDVPADLATLAADIAASLPARAAVTVSTVEGSRTIGTGSWWMHDMTAAGGLLGPGFGIDQAGVTIPRAGHYYLSAWQRVEMQTSTLMAFGVRDDQNGTMAVEGYLPALPTGRGVTLQRSAAAYLPANARLRVALIGDTSSSAPFLYTNRGLVESGLLVVGLDP